MPCPGATHGAPHLARQALLLDAQSEVLALSPTEQAGPVSEVLGPIERVHGPFDSMNDMLSQLTRAASDIADAMTVTGDQLLDFFAALVASSPTPDVRLMLMVDEYERRIERRFAAAGRRLDATVDRMEQDARRRAEQWAEEFASRDIRYQLLVWDKEQRMLVHRYSGAWSRTYRDE